MTRRVTPLLAIILLASAGYLSAQEAGTMCIVERIADGDTIACGGEKVRLLLVDAPEEEQGAFGRAAQAFLEAILPVGSGARLALDVEQRDQFGRLLAYVYLPDGRMVNALMVRQGFAVPLVVPPNVRHVEMIRAAADSARAARIGLWTVEAFECSPEEFRNGRCPRAVTVQPAPRSAAMMSEGRTAGEGCDPSYTDVCIPSPPPDLDCGDIPHKRFRAVGADPHEFDGNHDGVACEGPPQ